ncbi:sialic acid TRAP transporter substrate-binding protein SiaP [Modicisalibacter tunisiensis]|uniref:Sialic acid TRAP transporter substrate-binding protein SiaP n=1 Tax=Modicisalibacter tunisiensis TaxID=390637 RepID=A0ABS7X4B8_9GAMM|nr:sialic acid TRAP transporter substrate-binding protein SiaP [Modicisalibacter tunisiensis]MBZ9568986.1 sialic acid TRAP transporter substrate-binding protein SiaP [Modicisalibacter tunisiensis]
MGNTRTRHTRINRWISTAMLLAGISAAGMASAETLRFAHVYETSEPYHKWAVWAGDQIEKRTDGRYTVEVYPASSLGKEADINEGLSLGTIDLIFTGNQFAGRSYGPIGIAGAPYMFRDFDHWKAYAHSDLFKEIAKGYQDATGNVPLALNYYGKRHTTSNKPINTPADMKGLKIRVPNAPMYMMFPEAVGANPTPIAFSEVYLALQQGVVDAQENPLPTIKAKKFYEVQDYINLTGHITDSLLTIAGGPFWNRLSDEDKTIFRDVYQEAGEHITQDVRQSEAELVSWFEDQGVTVNKVDTKPFREAVMPYHNGDAATWDQETYDRLQALGQ